MAGLTVLPCLDSAERAEAHRRALRPPRHVAAALGRSAVEAARAGRYVTEGGAVVDWGDAVRAAREAAVSLPPEAEVSLLPEAELPDPELPEPEADPFDRTTVQVANETTFQAAQRLIARGLRPLALNFANGIHPGGGFLNGARAQEEVLCRSSALYETLVGDPMYAAHRERPLPDSTDWAILSPDVPVFRTDAGEALEHPWLLSFVTCAAPVATRVGQPRSGDLLRQRIHRVLAIARAYGYASLVLGAWGCGAFGNDPRRTAEDFREALEGPYRGAFSDVVFAIADWSPSRRYLGPFRDEFT